MPEPPPAPLLSVAGLSRRFGSLAAVDGVDLTVSAGDRHAVIGPNGAGKTTLLHLVSGSLRPSAGEVRLDGRPVNRYGPSRRARLGIGRTHQHPAVWPTLTVAENVSVGGRRPWGRSRALPDLLDRVGLTGHAGRPAGSLSHGQRRQLELAIALAGEPRLLLLDEPAAGLSPDEVERLAAVLADLPSSVTVVLVEHHLDLVFSLASTVTVLHSGRLIVSGPVDAVRSSAEAAAVYSAVAYPGAATAATTGPTTGAPTGPVT